ncbi:MAG TPA: phage major capsid protein [Pseudaminobacter sp.]|nr:phage major capsid protein [Pseudaminobacter sp.]
MSGYELAVRRADEAKQTAVAASRGLRDLQREVRSRDDPDRQQRELADRFVKHAVVKLVARNGEDTGEVFAQRYPRLVEKSVTNPAMTTVPGWAAELIPAETSIAFLSAQPGASLLARLGALSQSVTKLTRIVYDANPTEVSGAWIGEGQSIPLAKRVLASRPLEASKLISISVFSNELLRRSTIQIEITIAAILRQSLNKLIDRSLTDDQPPSAVRPGGLRYGIPPIAAGASMTEDLQALVRAILDAGGENIVFCVNPLQALAIGLSGGSIDMPVLSSVNIAPGMILAVDAGSFAAWLNAASIEKSSESTLMLLDDPPPTGSLMDSPPVVSTLQQDLVGLRVSVDCGWGIAGGRVAWLEDAQW